MELKIKTIKLQEMVSKAIKGASNNKMIPITGLMGIEVKKKVLTLTTTDATNTLKIIEKDLDNPDFSIVLQSDIFSKLVSKMTTEFITMVLKEDTLEVTGNGTYKISLPLDEEGQLIKFPDYKFDSKAKKLPIKLAAIKTILVANKAALAITMESPCLTGYYFGEKVITTDTFKVCANDIKIFPQNILLPSELIELLALSDEENINVQVAGSKILFTGERITIYGSALDGLEDFPAAAVEEYLTTSFPSHCEIGKNILLNILDRLSLFVSVFDKNGIYLTFTPEGILFSSKKSNGTELIKYTSVKDFKPFTCCVDIQLFNTQVAAQEGEKVDLWFGNEAAIKMTSGKITQILSLLEDERESTPDGE